MDHKIEAFGFGKRPEVPIPRKESDPPIDAALGDQSISEPRFTALCQRMASQLACTLPIAGSDPDQRQLCERLRHL